MRRQRAEAGSDLNKTLHKANITGNGKLSRSVLYFLQYNTAQREENKRKFKLVENLTVILAENFSFSSLECTPTVMMAGMWRQRKWRLVCFTIQQRTLL